MQKHRNILLLFGRYEHRFHLGVSRYAGEHRWNLCADLPSTGVIPYGWHGDGILTTLNQNNRLLNFIRRAKLPTVDLIIQRPDIRLPRVVGDNEAIGRIAAEHFIERGFCLFAWYSDYFTNIEQLRLKGFCERLATRNFSCHKLVWSLQRKRKNAGGWRDQRVWIGRQLLALPGPLAVLAFSDYDAATVMDSCMILGLRVPDEVAILGVNNSELICNWLPVPLSSINHDMEKIGYEGAVLLDKLINGAATPRKPVLLPPRGITLRQSTDIMAVNQTLVRSALKFLRENFNRSIGTTEVIAGTGISRRVLEKLFRRHLHRTVHEELMRLRIQHARELLLHSNTTSAEIAKATGFCHPQHFNNAFHKAEGLTPRKYRLSFSHHDKDHAK